MNVKKVIKINFNLYTALFMFFIGLSFGAFFLGSSLSDDDNEINVNDYLTPLETSILSKYYEEHSSGGYALTLNALKDKRYNSRKYINETPFCDVLDVLKIEETPDRASMSNGYAISKQWERISGISLEVSCKGVTKVNSENSLSKDIVMIKNERFLAPHKIVELSKLTQTCESSKSKLSALMGGGKYIPESDYEKIIQIELDCAYFNLNTEINK